MNGTIDLYRLASIHMNANPVVPVVVWWNKVYNQWIVCVCVLDVLTIHSQSVLIMVQHLLVHHVRPSLIHFNLYVAGCTSIVIYTRHAFVQ